MSPSIPAASGIYRITCTLTGRFYIGSAINLQTRQAQHLYALRNNQHHTQPLQNAFNKYGEDAFTFEVIELVLPMFQVEREQYWLDALKPFGKRGFNINRTANKPAFSPETCERIRLAKLGHSVSQETRDKLRTTKTGRKRSPEAYASVKKMLIVTFPDGTEQVVHGIKLFCRDHHLDLSSLMRVAKGEYTQHKGYKARYPDID